MYKSNSAVTLSISVFSSIHFLFSLLFISSHSRIDTLISSLFSLILSSCDPPCPLPRPLCPCSIPVDVVVHKTSLCCIMYYVLSALNYHHLNRDGLCCMSNTCTHWQERRVPVVTSTVVLKQCVMACTVWCSSFRAMTVLFQHLALFVGLLSCHTCGKCSTKFRIVSQMHI